MQDERSRSDALRRQHETMLAEQVAQLQEEKDRSLEEIQARVEITLRKKDETVRHLKEQFQASQLRLQETEALLAQQRENILQQVANL